MATIADLVEEFLRRAKAGEQPKVRVRKEHVAVLLGELVRHGVKLADECLEQIRDRELREIIRTVLLSATAGALLGAAVGAPLGPHGAKVGAVLGAAAGVVVGAFAVLVRYREESGPHGPELVVEAA